MKNWFKMAMEAENAKSKSGQTVTMYRGEPIDPSSRDERFNSRRLQLLRASIGKPYPPNFEPVYATPDLRVAKQYDGITYGKFNLNPKTVVQVVTTMEVPFGAIEIDEAAIKMLYQWADVFDPMSAEELDQDPYLVRKRIQAFRKIFGPAVDRHLDAPAFSDKGVISKAVDPERVNEWRSQLKEKGKLVKTPDTPDMKEMDRKLGETLKNAMEGIRKDPNIIRYFIAHQPKDSVVEWAFRINPSAAKVTKVEQ